MQSREFWVYILSSKTRRLYVGVTSDLVRRVFQHKEGVVPGFTRRYGITRLVYVERIDKREMPSPEKSRSKAG